MNRIRLVTGLSLVFTFGFAGSAHARDCFLIQEKEKIVKTEGNCAEAFTPQSTFKIPLSLMGFDSGTLKSETDPTFPFTSKHQANINVCKGDHSPRTWMRDSCVWFSQDLTRKLGMEKFAAYVTKFNYGNKDVSGEQGKNNGLTHSWLNSSILITPQEQIRFIQRFANNDLPVNKHAVEMTKSILYLQELPGGWKLYGKTGSGRLKNKMQQGWFVGWIEKGPRKLVFAHHIADETEQKSYASFRSKNDALLKLWDVIEEMEK